jgi:WD40 repeat protein
MIKITIISILFCAAAGLFAQDAVILTGNKGNVNSIAISPHSKVIVSGDEKGNLIFWDISSSAKLYSLETGSNITSVNYSPAELGLLIYTFYDGEVTIMKGDRQKF